MHITRMQVAVLTMLNVALVAFVVAMVLIDPIRAIAGATALALLPKAGA